MIIIGGTYFANGIVIVIVIIIIISSANLMNIFAFTHQKKIISSAKGIPQDSEGGYNQLEEVLCGKEEKEDLEFCSLCIFWSI